MTRAAFGSAVIVSLVILAPATAWSGDTAGRTRVASTTTCVAALAAPVAEQRLYAGTDARQANRSRVRYTAMHAMPSRPKTVTVAEAGCTTTKATALD